MARLDRVERAVADISAGRAVVVVDDEDRENEGDGGELRRPGHTEAAVDLARLAGLRPAGVICEVVSQLDSGAMAGSEELQSFADEHDLALISISDLISWRRRHETHVRRVCGGARGAQWCFICAVTRIAALVSSTQVAGPPAARPRA